MNTSFMATPPLVNFEEKIAAEKARLQAQSEKQQHIIAMKTLYQKERLNLQKQLEKKLTKAYKNQQKEIKQRNEKFRTIMEKKNETIQKVRA